MYFLVNRQFATQQITKCGSNKTHIDSLTLNIFKLTFDHNIHLEVFWVGRKNNKEADKISKTIDFDQGRYIYKKDNDLYFLLLNRVCNTA